MITLKELKWALGQHLVTLPDVPSIAWETKTFDPSKTYLEASLVPASRENDTMAQDDSAIVQTGIFLVTVNTPLDKFSDDADDMAQAIADLFHGNLRLSAGTGHVLIYKPSEPISGFKSSDETKWQQPIRINYQTEE